MILFDPEVFSINPDIISTRVTTPLCAITILDNFYRDFDKVIEQYDKLPVALTVYNDNDCFDGRKCYVSNMKGTEIPSKYEYPELVGKTINYTGNAIERFDSVLINCNKLLSDRYNDEYYNIHVDPKNINFKDSIATVIFLNREYGEGDGMNTYYPPKRQFLPWTPKDEVEINYFIQGKPNRAIVFSPNLFHGPAFGKSSRFEHEMRYTQVIFTGLG